MNLVTKKNNLLVFSGLLIIFSMISSILIKSNVEALDLQADSAILIDYDSGKILYEKNADELLPPASMSKMLTEYIVLEAIENGEISWDTKTRVSDYGHWISTNNDFSGIAFSKETDYSVEKLYEAMAIYSDNAAVITLIELIAGTETEYVKLMNEKTKELGMKDSHFVNATGINNSALKGRHAKGTDEKATNKATARDLAVLGYRLVTDFPEILEIASKTETEFYGTTLTNWNWMLKNDSPYLSQFYYEGVDGIKTGNSGEAGHSFTGTVERDGQRFISVVMKTNTEPARFVETGKLYDYGFETFKQGNMTNLSSEKKLTVENGEPIGFDVEGEVNIPINQKENPEYDLSINLDKDKINKSGELIAPIKKGEEIGTANVVIKSSDYGYLLNELEEKQFVKIIAQEDIKKNSWFSRLKEAIFNIFS